jgi:hypothetical protein
LIPTGSSRWLRQVPIGAMAKRGRCVSTRKERPLDVPAHGQRVVSEGKISWPTRGPNVGQRIGSTMRSGANPGTKAPANEHVHRRSSSGVVVPDSACHAGGRMQPGARCTDTISCHHRVHTRTAREGRYGLYERRGLAKSARRAGRSTCPSRGSHRVSDKPAGATCGCTFWDTSGTHVARSANENPRFTGVSGADDGTRTHDLLHGKSWRAFAPVRSCSLKPPVCSGFGSGVRTRANPSERRVQPLQPL